MEIKAIKYLSPSSIDLWRRDRVEFYFRYMMKAKQLPQTQPMAVGSAFDAYVKAWIMERLYGSVTINGKSTDLRGLFEQQVDSQHHAWAWDAGREAMDLYRDSGALSDLMLELDEGTDHRFETIVQGKISGVPLLGRPDLCFKKGDVNVIIDWKVNGWCSAKPPSPVPGYKMCRTLKDGVWKRKTHASAVVLRGIDVVNKMEDLNAAWATQLSIYAWVLGVEVGEEFICGIDQLVGRNRVSSLRNKVSGPWQHALLAEICDIWIRIQQGCIFDEVPGGPSNTERIAMLDDYAAGYKKDTSEHREWLEDIIRGG